MSQDERYKQLALFSVIMAEVVVTPVALGGLIYALTRNLPGRGLYAALGALAGLVIAFYRISLLMKKRKPHDSEGK
jgi:ABC-type nitrate/sulfonate/bicarbonate transport system permease component